MRPTVDVPAANQYECIECGSRTAPRADRVCPECGGSLRDLSLSRDL
jgi:hypothetical protein